MHTSGITVDETVSDEFSAAKQDPTTLFLQYRIATDRFTRTSTGHRTSSRHDDFLAIQRTLNPTEPSFIIAHPTPLSPTSSTADKWLLIFFMPDTASVRDRMIYSSSSSALKDGLGSSSFTPHTFNIRDPSSCTQHEYDQQTNTQLNDVDLMTNDEIAAKEAETSSHLAMSSTRVSAIVGLPIQIDPASIPKILSIQSNPGHSVLLRLDSATETLHADEEGEWTFEEAASHLPSGEPRYLLTSFLHTYNGQQVTSCVFYYYCPDLIKPKLKMVYSTSKGPVMGWIETEGVKVDKSLEISDKAEMTTAAVMDALHPSVEVKKGFKKPARPGRGNARLIGKEGE
jgi:twinfilin-like protein